MPDQDYTAAAVSVIIPALDAAATLPACLAAVTPLMNQGVEILLVDGGSLDGTREVANDTPGVQLISASRGRASQMNAGARQAQGDILLFLHADTILPAGWLPAVRSVLSSKQVSLGGFRFALDSATWQARVIEWGVYLRILLFKQLYGDQALFLRAKDFRNGLAYPEIPLFEDVDLVAKARQHGRLCCLKLSARTSARRWLREGWVRASWQNFILLKSYLKNPDRVAELAERYLHPGPALCVFCKYPDPGKVKTRLAKEIGLEEAAHVYRELVGQTLDTAKQCTAKTYVYYDPPQDQQRFRTWLGPAWRLVPQCPGDLGARMLHAGTEQLENGHSSFVVIGTDCPQITHALVDKAIYLLRNNDLVLGPSHDGGYYLLGCKRPLPELFIHMPWSTPQVMPETLKRAQNLGLTVAQLPKLHDVDTAAELVHLSKN